MPTRADLLGRFPLLENMRPRQIRRFEQDLATLRPHTTSDNREQRRAAAESIVDRLRISPGEAAIMAANLMIYQDSTSECRTTRRDSHTPSRKRRQTGSTAPQTPQSGREHREHGHEGGRTVLDDTPEGSQIPTPGDTPSRAPPAPLQAHVNAQTEKSPICGPTVDGLTLENGMLRAQLTETQYENFELQLALARNQGETMAENEKRMQLVRDVKGRIDEEE